MNNSINIDLLVEAAAVHGQLVSGIPLKFIAKQSSLGAGAVAILSNNNQEEQHKGKAPRWTRQEDEFLKTSLGFLSEEDIAQHLGRTVSGVHIRWKRELQLAAPSRNPEWITAEQVAQGIGCDSKSVHLLIDREILPGRRLPCNRVIRMVHKNAILCFITNPLNWIYFHPERLGNTPKRSLTSYDKGFWEHAKRLVMKRKSLWNDQWLTIGQAAEILGIPHGLINNAIHRGEYPNGAKQWGNWFILASSLPTKNNNLKAWNTKGHVHKPITKRAEAFLVLAEAVGLMRIEIAPMIGINVKSVSYILDQLMNKNRIPEIIREHNLPVYYNSATKETFASWKMHKTRFKSLANKMVSLSKKQSLSKSEARNFNFINKKEQGYRLFTTPKHSIPSAKELAINKPHGTRIRYMAGCKCNLCKAANTGYETDRAKKRKLGLDNGLTSTIKAKSHMQKLAKNGIGRRTVSNISGISQTIISKINNGTRQNIRKDTERKILAVTLNDAAGNQIVDAKSTWKLINKLLDSGMTKKHLAQQLGLKQSLQIGKEFVTAKNANKVKELFTHMKSSTQLTDSNTHLETPIGQMAA